MQHLRTFLAASWVALGAIPIALINAYLGTASLLVGISYQLWKWRRDIRKPEVKPKG